MLTIQQPRPFPVVSRVPTPSSMIPVVSRVPTMILGMDVSHGSPGQSDVPSIAAVVNSRQWPSIYRYRASVRTQSPRVEMIDSLFKRVSDRVDGGVMRFWLFCYFLLPFIDDAYFMITFAHYSGSTQDGSACKNLDENWNPRFVVIVAQKNHRTRFFQQGSPDNVLPGTVIDNTVCHPQNNDFYLCAHAGMIGTTRPTHYHVLLDEIGFSADELQELVHSLSYTNQRSTTAISVVAPIWYAHLAASQLGTFLKFDEAPETSSSHGGVTAPGAIPVPQLPWLNKNVSDSMFFC
ncbi:protein argonaute 4A-like [Durio zibethinus]|uniref:Protein argonaute 4A-like n=1 Tax=Durio zibethinus TaxID=66656 RepID=A0A6P5Y723_DURZI|nr:protein argonaute 4A-like [Durio zibethinus]